MPRKEFEAFTRLDASDVNTYLMDQSVMSFAGTAARGSAIPSPVTGMTTYLEDDDALQVFDGAAYAGVGGLTFVKKQIIGSAVTSVTVSDAFSSDYENYKIIISGGVASTDVSLQLQLGASNTAYNTFLVRGFYSDGTSSNVGTNNGTIFTLSSGSTNSLFLNVDVIGPFLSKNTYISAPFVGASTAGHISGVLKNTTSFTAFTINSSGGNMTGGTIYVYGYRKA
jgi:hypothetical protein